MEHQKRPLGQSVNYPFPNTSHQSYYPQQNIYQSFPNSPIFHSGIQQISYAPFYPQQQCFTPTHYVYQQIPNRVYYPSFIQAPTPTIPSYPILRAPSLNNRRNIQQSFSYIPNITQITKGFLVQNKNIYCSRLSTPIFISPQVNLTIMNNNIFKEKQLSKTDNQRCGSETNIENDEVEINPNVIIHSPKEKNLNETKNETENTLLKFVNKVKISNVNQKIEENNTNQNNKNFLTPPTLPFLNTFKDKTVQNLNSPGKSALKQKKIINKNTTSSLENIEDETNENPRKNTEGTEEKSKAIFKTSFEMDTNNTDENDQKIESIVLKPKDVKKKPTLPLNSISPESLKDLTFMLAFHGDLAKKNAENVGSAQLSHKKIKSRLQSDFGGEFIPEFQEYEHTGEFLQMPNIPYIRDFVKIYENCNQSNKNFVDPEFQPDISSILEKNNSIKIDAWSDFVWKRPMDFFEGSYWIFSKEDFDSTFLKKQTLRKSSTLAAIDCDDIVQGSLGDCYFLSSLSSLAELPQRIRKLFISKKVNETVGAFCVNICHEGEWRAVYIDDYFPCFPDGSGPAFSKSPTGQNELWVLILEKAWAKLYGNYERIEAGLTREVLRDLTGAPTKVVWTDDPNAWSEILDGEERDYIMTAGANDSCEIPKELLMKGMVSGHAYSLISAYEFRGEKLVKMRNPWGKGEWRGPWGDADPIWNSVSQEDKDRMGYKKSEDGSFFMNLQYFKRIYGDVQICMIEDHYKYVSKSITTKKKNGVYHEFEVKTEGKYYITILQKSTRKMNDPNYKYSQGKIVLGMKNDNDLEFINARQLTHREVFIECQLKLGIYVLYCKVDWQCSSEDNFVLSSYGVDDIVFHAIEKPSDFIEKVYMSKAMKSTNKEFSRESKVEKNVEVFPKE